MTTELPNYAIKDCGSTFTIPQNSCFTHIGSYNNVCFLKSVLEGMKMMYNIDTKKKEIKIFDTFIDRMYKYNLIPNEEIKVPGHQKFIRQIEKDWDISINVFTKFYIRAYPIQINNDTRRIINIQHINGNHFVLIEYYDRINVYD